VREFIYDKLGRLTDDHVTAIGTADTAIYKISRTYEVRGMVETITSYDGSSAIVNQVQLDYNEFSQLSVEWQAHEYPGVTGSTPNVQYAYDAGGSSSNEIRPTSVTYPDSKVITFDYGSSANDLLSRIESIIDGSTVLGTYTYLGLGTIIRLKYPQPDAWLDLWGGTSGIFAGLDDFGRVKDQLWQNNVSTTPVTIDYYQYGYDRNSNRQYRANKVGTTPVGVTPERKLDEYYTYDNLNRLTVMQRGRLTGGPPPTGISGTPTAEQDWTLDPTGNWNGFITKAAGSQTLNQTRTQNKVNEITGISETVGSAWRIGGWSAWLHAAVGQDVVAYLIHRQRGADAASLLIGWDYAGKLIHDRLASYLRFLSAIHQMCLGHLLRRCHEMLERATRRGGWLKQGLSLNGTFQHWA
jgi:hypothetical protein